MRENPIKPLLGAGGAAFGVMHLELGTLGSPRLADSAGADFAIWDMEHTGWTTETIRQVMAAARLGRAWPLVRVPRAHYHLIGGALDSGAMGVMVPMIETAEQAQLVVDSVKYPPVGKRGYGAVYPDMTPDGPAGWMEASNRETMVIVQIETVRGLECADAIIGTAGVDVAWVGHFDLTASMGIPGRFEHPDYLAAVQQLVAAATSHGKALGIMVTTADAGREALAQGFRCVALGDIWVYHDALGRITTELRGSATEMRP